MSNGATGVEAALQEAMTGKPASSPDATKETKTTTTATETKETAPVEKTIEDKTDTTSNDKEKSHEQTIPYERLKQEVDKVATLKGNLESKDERIAALEKEMDAFKEKLTDAEEDLDVLDRLRNLQTNDKFRPMLETLDKAIQGVETDVEEGKKTEKEAESEVKNLLEATKREIKEEVQQERLDRLQSQSETLLDQYIQNLPSEYTDEERETIRELTLPRVTWSKIEKDPSTIKQTIADGLEKALKKHGQPRGVLQKEIEQLKEAQKGNETQETQQKVDPQEVVKQLVDTDWSEKNDKGALVKSDQNFTDALADAIRNTRV